MKKEIFNNVTKSKINENSKCKIFEGKFMF